MKVLGKNVVIGTKKICIEYTHKISRNSLDSFTETTEYKGEELEANVVFIRDSKGYFVQANELGSFPTLSLICYGAATRWKTTPHGAGDIYIDEIKPYFPKNNQEILYDIKTLIELVQHVPLLPPKETSNIKTQSNNETFTQ